MQNKFASIRHRSVWTTVIIGALFATSLSGCDRMRKMRAWFHPEEQTADGFGDAGLRVDVEPPDGITILLDDVRVATLAPYTHSHLKAGEHKLEVRAMGYHTLTLPVVLVDHETLAVPVHLRRRPERNRAANKTKRPPSPRRPRPTGPPPTPPPATGAVGAALSSEAQTVRLTFLLAPPGEVRVDGKTTTGRNVALTHANGPLDLAGARFRYAISKTGVLTLTPPNDNAQWTRDGRPMKASKSFKLNQGSVRFKRTSKTGEVRTFLMRR